MRLYPRSSPALARTVGGDLVVAVLIALFAWLGTTVHDRVEELLVVSSGVERAGTDIRGGLQQAADRVGSLPFVGDDLARALRDAGGNVGGAAIAAGRDSRAGVEELADTLGWALFALPTVLLLVPYVPRRAAQVRHLGAAARALEAGAGQRSVLAHRAAYGAPYATLLRHTPDPFGDLARGRHDELVAAAYDDAGLAAPVAAQPGR